jgi:hypothetical protein
MIDAIFFDDICDVRRFEAHVEGMVGHIPWSIYDESENF